MHKDCLAMLKYLSNASRFSSLASCCLLSACLSSNEPIDSKTSTPAADGESVICSTELSDIGYFVENYHTENVCGWTVQMSRELFDDTLAETAFNALKADLQQIENRLPAVAIQGLRQTTIWLELNLNVFPGGVYHPSAQWLAENGYPAKWAKGVQFGVARNYLNWRNDQPAMLLHELAHAYDDAFYNSNNADVLAAFREAVNSGKYRSVEYFNGEMQQAHALTNAKEYFAELTEAYFWRNDFFPFDREQLSSFDLPGYEAIELMWQP